MLVSRHHFGFLYEDKKQTLSLIFTTFKVREVVCAFVGVSHRTLQQRTHVGVGLVTTISELDGNEIDFYLFSECVCLCAIYSICIRVCASVCVWGGGGERERARTRRLNAVC